MQACVFVQYNYYRQIMKASIDFAHSFSTHLAYSKPPEYFKYNPCNFFIYS